MTSMIIWIWGKNIRGGVAFSLQHITLITWLGWSLPDFSTENLLFFPFLTHSVCKSVTKVSLHPRGEESTSSARKKKYHIICGYLFKPQSLINMVEEII